MGVTISAAGSAQLSPFWRQLKQNEFVLKIKYCVGKVHIKASSKETFVSYLFDAPNYTFEPSNKKPELELFE